MLGHNVAFVVLLNAIKLVRTADTAVNPLVVTVTAKLRDRDKITLGETLHVVQHRNKWRAGLLLPYVPQGMKRIK